jgi:hypothetical protein
MTRPEAQALWLALAATALAAQAAAPPADPLEHFEKAIRPLLVARCLECHSGADPAAGLRLDSRAGIVSGGESGPAIVPNAPAASRLLRVVRSVDEPRMPPDGRLADVEIAALETWIAAGAPMPAGTIGTGAEVAPRPPAAWAPSPDQMAWWSFQPIADPLPPAVDGDWVMDDIDRFILADLRARGLEPAPAADRATWLRRVTFDLTGLPPEPAEIDAFLADESPAASAHVVDRLLAAPAHGERFARHWLDVVRYADYHDGDPAKRNAVCEPLEAWRYRDWVVRAFNDDLPYDRFVELQICGDLLPAPDGAAIHADGLVATTFLVNGAWDRGDADKEKLVSDMVDDQIDTVGKAFLGLTLGCARCHDHKYDPVSQADYYALAGIFYSTRMLEELGTKGGEITLQRRLLVPRAVADARRQGLALAAHLDASLAALDRGGTGADDPERIAIGAERDRLVAATPPEPPQALAVSEGGVPGGLFPGIQDVPIHLRGTYARLGPIVPRRMPAFLAAGDQPPIGAGSGRRALAHWLTSPANPLTARVIVNRVWQWHFGRGLVPTASNVGLLAEPPSHPALLEWLTRRFVAEGWSLKRLHRRIVLSATYRQSGGANAADFAADPDNRWLGRMPPRRLEAEALRDAMLAAAGTLDDTRGGPATHDVARPRRSLYVQTARWDRGGFATLFDAANPDAVVERRDVSTVAPQALWLLNNPFVLRVAADLAARLCREVPDDGPTAPARRVDLAWRLLFGRQPRSDEATVALELVAAGGAAGWTDLAHVLLCSNGLAYVD